MIIKIIEADAPESDTKPQIIIMIPIAIKYLSGFLKLVFTKPLSFPQPIEIPKVKLIKAEAKAIIG